MDRRRSVRKRVSISAEITTGDINCSGIIENISEKGICLETDSEDILGTTTVFQPGSEFRIKFKTPSGEEISLHCKVIWSFKVAPHGLKIKVGMENIFPPPSYIDFYRNYE